MTHSICASQSSSKLITLVNSAHQCTTELDSLIPVITRELEWRENKGKKVFLFRPTLYHLTLIRLKKLHIKGVVLCEPFPYMPKTTYLHS